MSIRVYLWLNFFLRSKGVRTFTHGVGCACSLEIASTKVTTAEVTTAKISSATVSEVAATRVATVEIAAATLPILAGAG